MSESIKKLNTGLRVKLVKLLGKELNIKQIMIRIKEY